MPSRRNQGCALEALKRARLARAGCGDCEIARGSGGKNKHEAVMNDIERTATPIGIFGQIMVFAAKTCIVVVAISVCALFVAETVMDNLQDVAARTISDLRKASADISIGGRQLGAKVEQELDREADPSSDLSAERKQKLIHDVHVIVARWRPFIEAVQSEMQKPAGAN
jgi:hypothetical protein